MEETRCQKTMKYKGNLNTKLLSPQNDENALMFLLHSTDEVATLKTGSSLYFQTFVKEAIYLAIIVLTFGEPFSSMVCTSSLEVVLYITFSVSTRSPFEGDP